MATTKPTMTANDWLDLMELDKEELRKQGWGEMLTNGSIRNKQAQCPLCAFAELHGSDHYLSIADIALQEAFGRTQDLGGILEIMDAADLCATPLHLRAIRARLRSILEVPQ